MRDNFFSGWYLIKGLVLLSHTFGLYSNIYLFKVSLSTQRLPFWSYYLGYCHRLQDYVNPMFRRVLCCRLQGSRETLVKDSSTRDPTLRETTELSI